MSDTNKITTGTDSNPDPITGEPGSHPIGTGVGAAGAGATGAAIGAAAGPVGAVVGAAVGAVVGGLAGKGVAEAIDPTAEDNYWRQNHASQSYAGTGSYDQYSSAYRTGYSGVSRFGADRDYPSVENDLKADYERTKDHAGVAWEHAKEATRSAYERARQSIKRNV